MAIAQMKHSRFYYLFPLALLVGCAGTMESQHPRYAPSEWVQPQPAQRQSSTGTIFTGNDSLGLFEDYRARRVGDILSVVLQESTAASKSSDTSIDKQNETSITDPIVGGVVGTTNFEVGLDSGNSFSGAAASNQSNSLNGQIAVTVAEVLPNGNLYIQGEKWIQINQGSEFIRLRGMVRPEDISSDNRIASNRIADAKISYSGTGAPADANSMGWLSRFFNSSVWPF